MERLKSIKKESEIALAGISATVTTENGNFRQVRLVDSQGNVLVLKSDYGLGILVPEPPKTKKVWLWKTTNKSLNAERRFDDKWDAEKFDLSAKEELRGLETSLEEVEVPSDEL